MKMKKKLLAMITMVAMLVSVAATPATSSAATAKEYLDNMAVASASTTSLKMNMSAVLNLKSTGEMTFSLDVATTVNPLAAAMSLTMDYGMVMGALAGEQAVNTMQMYLVPDATGVYYTYMFDGTTWMKQSADMTTTDLNAITSATTTEMDTSLFSSLKVTSESVMIGDKECVAVSAQIAGKKIWKEAGKIDKSYKKELKMLKKCKPIVFNYYIDKATNLPVKMTVNANKFIKSYMKADKSISKADRKEFKSLSFEINYSDINAVPAIVLPPEAQNAIDANTYYDNLYGTLE